MVSDNFLRSFEDKYGNQTQSYITTKIGIILESPKYKKRQIIISHERERDPYDMIMINEQGVPPVIIEFEKIDNIGNSDWRKGTIPHWAYKNSPLGIHIPYRKKHDFMIDNSYWLKSNTTYDSFIIIRGSDILKFPIIKFPNYRTERDGLSSLFYVVNAKSLGEKGLCAVSLERVVDFMLNMNGLGRFIY